VTWQPADNFYEGYSLWQTLGYGPQGEIERAKKVLSNLGYDASETETKEFLELTKDLQELVKTECQEEISALQHISKKSIIVGDTPPLDLSLAMSIAELILLAASVGVSVLDYLHNKSKSTVDNKQVFDSALKKLCSKKDANEMIVEKTERWRVSFRKKTSQK
jgi:hypothetical protein